MRINLTGTTETPQRTTDSRITSSLRPANDRQRAVDAAHDEYNRQLRAIEGGDYGCSGPVAAREAASRKLSRDLRRIEQEFGPAAPTFIEVDEDDDPESEIFEEEMAEQLATHPYTTELPPPDQLPYHQVDTSQCSHGWRWDEMSAELQTTWTAVNDMFSDLGIDTNPCSAMTVAILVHYLYKDQDRLGIPGSLAGPMWTLLYPMIREPQSDLEGYFDEITSSFTDSVRNTTLGSLLPQVVRAVADLDL